MLAAEQSRYCYRLFMCVYLCLSVSIKTEVDVTWCVYVLHWTLEVVRFWWRLALTCWPWELLTYYFTEKIAYNLRITGQIVKQFDVIMCISRFYDCDQLYDCGQMGGGWQQAGLCTLGPVWFHLCPVIAVAMLTKTQKSAAVQSAPDVETCAPPYWEYYHGSLESCILRMHRSPLPIVAPSSNHRALMLVRSFMLRTWRFTRGSVDIISVKRIENPMLYRRYIARRREIALATQGNKRPIVKVCDLPDEKEIFTNLHGKCYRLCCYFLL